MWNGQIATYDGYLPLDGILAYAYMRRHHPEKLEEGTIKSAEELIPIELPLEKRGSGDDWYYACSFATFDCLEEVKRYWHKRLDQRLAEDLVDFGKRRGTVDVKSSSYKAYRMPLNIMLIPKLEWYAVGDHAEIESLLKYITHIGKKPAQGYGRVASWKVEPWEEDLSHQRPTPDQNGNMMMAIRPPYWLNEHQRMCVWNQ